METDIYYYHSDHLGSSSWITSTNGSAIQHIQYHPFGETNIDQRAGDWNARYTFSGKEKDEERRSPREHQLKLNCDGEQTGYHYFGARYYNSSLGIWLSVDPMAGKYPGLSPYVYCANNPIILRDPDGRDIVPTNKEGNAAIHTYLNKFNDKVIFNVFKLGENKTGTPAYFSESVEGYDKFSNINTFQKAMKSNGANLKGDELNEAFAFYQALSSSEIYTVDGVVSGSTFTFGTENQGSQVSSSGEEGFRKRLNSNKNLTNAIGKYIKTNNADVFFDSNSADKVGNGFSYYENETGSKNTKGSIFLDTRNPDWKTNLGKAFKTAFE